MWVREAQVHRRGPGVAGGQSIWWGELYYYHLHCHNYNYDIKYCNDLYGNQPVGLPSSQEAWSAREMKTRDPKTSWYHEFMILTTLSKISGWKEDVWNLFSLSAARERERAGLRVFRESVRQSPSTEPALDAFCRNSRGAPYTLHRLTDSRTSRLDTRSDTPPISIFWCSSLKQRVCSQTLLFKNKFNDEDSNEGEVLEFPAAWVWPMSCLLWVSDADCWW